jgi:hypothetical protein
LGYLETVKEKLTSLDGAIDKIPFFTTEVKVRISSWLLFAQSDALGSQVTFGRAFLEVGYGSSAEPTVTIAPNDEMPDANTRQ